MITLHVELDTVAESLKVNMLSSNTAKTKYMYVIFGSQHNLRNNIHYNLLLNGEEVERVYLMKYLGVILDDRLSFTKHI